MPTFGRLEEFEDGTDWSEYRERVEQFFSANDVTADKQKAVFLSCCGAKTYSILRSLLAPQTPADRDLTSIFSALDAYFALKCSEVLARYKFNSRVRREGEYVSDFVAALRRLTEGCDYGTFQETMLRDRIVCGVNDTGMQTRLLETPDLTYDLAVKTLLAMETAQKDSREISKTENLSAGACAINSAQQRPCYRCNGKHAPDDCPFSDAACFRCKKRGHIVRMCQEEDAGRHSDWQRVRRKNRGPRKGKGTRYHQGDVHNVDDSDESSDTVVYAMWSASARGTVDPFIVNVEIEGKPIEMELDTGASVSVMGEETLKTHYPGIEVEASSVLLRSFSGELAPVVGKATVWAKYREKRSALVKGKGPSLLGRTWMKELLVPLPQWEEARTVSVQDVVARHCALFQAELGEFQGVEAKIHLKPDAQPKFFKPRPVPLALQEGVAHELERLRREGIISPVRTAEWAAPVVPVLKQDGRIRLCGDFKVTINPVTQAEKYPVLE
ncbi:uncharacterized protein K02A2.6-like [Ornithodoros turicata]|uniref:uncharacterized protein K02A2.6-like n=1 Tax=Ornithodoros turicata TaxID=34597 RepID=UPI0031396BC8